MSSTKKKFNNSPNKMQVIDQNIIKIEVIDQKYATPQQNKMQVIDPKNTSHQPNKMQVIDQKIK